MTECNKQCGRPGGQQREDAQQEDKSGEPGQGRYRAQHEEYARGRQAQVGREACRRFQRPSIDRLPANWLRRGPQAAGRPFPAPADHRDKQQGKKGQQGDSEALGSARPAGEGNSAGMMPSANKVTVEQGEDRQRGVPRTGSRQRPERVICLGPDEHSRLPRRERIRPSLGSGPAQMQGRGRQLAVTSPRADVDAAGGVQTPDLQQECPLGHEPAGPGAPGAINAGGLRYSEADFLGPPQNRQWYRQASDRSRRPRHTEGDCAGFRLGSQRDADRLYVRPVSRTRFPARDRRSRKPTSASHGNRP